MSYYIHDWGDGRLSLYKMVGEEHYLLAYRARRGWETRPQGPWLLPAEWGNIEITKEEVAMILFGCKGQA